MRSKGFARTLVFGALAAALLPAWMLLSRPLLGQGAALQLYLVASMALYVAGLATRPARRLAAGLLALLLGAGVLVLAGGTAQVALGAAAVLGVCRSGLLHQARRARSLLLEVALLAGGLAFAGFLATPSLVGIALALWGFFLVQSVYFLVGGIREADSGSPAGLDPFDLARARALALFEED